MITVLTPFPLRRKPRNLTRPSHFPNGTRSVLSKAGFRVMTPGNMHWLLNRLLQKLGSPLYLQQQSTVNTCCVLGWEWLWTLSHHLLITLHIFSHVKCLAQPHGLGKLGSFVPQTAWRPAGKKPVKCWKSLKKRWLSQPFCQRESLSTSNVL